MLFFKSQHAFEDPRLVFPFGMFRVKRKIPQFLWWDDGVLIIPQRVLMNMCSSHQSQLIQTRPATSNCDFRDPIRFAILHRLGPFGQWPR
jgi:hypothetical protein